MLTATEKQNLMSAMKDLLDEYYYEYSTYSLDDIIEEWAEQKATLIEAFKRHPNYVEGKFMIAFDSNYEREIDTVQCKEFSRWIQRIMIDYVGTLPSEMNERRIRDGASYLPYDLYYFLVDLDRYSFRIISDDLAYELNRIVPEIHAHSGQKTSRVINKLLTYLGYAKHPDYNKEFAKYADALSPMTIKRHTVLSLNPLDYLTMSFGNSWASCHTIDKDNKRGMPNSYSGMYSSGTISYMLDPSSMVFYTVDASYDGDEYWTQPKINRQMFHYGEDKLVQGRLYPQSNDGDGTVYEPYRKIVQNIMSIIFDFPNLWTLRKGIEPASKYIITKGTHYPDYIHFCNCTLSLVSDRPNEKSFVVGAKPICIECGERHDVEDNINCCDSDLHTCADCGRRINDDDAYWINGECYCENCVTYCECCDEYYRGDGVWIECEDRYVCDYCADRYYTECEDCGEYIPDENRVYIDGADAYVCEDCFEANYFRCEVCDCYHHNDNANTLRDGRVVCEDCFEEITENEYEDENEEEAV